MTNLIILTRFLIAHGGGKNYDGVQFWQSALNADDLSAYSIRIELVSA